MTNKLVSIELSIESFDGKIIESHTSNDETIVEGFSIREDFDSAWCHMISEGVCHIETEIDNEMYDTACKFIDSPHLEGTIRFDYKCDLPITVVVTVKK